MLRNNRAIEYYSGKKIKQDENDKEAVIEAIKNTLDMTRSVRFPQSRLTKTDEDGFIIRQQEWTSWIESRPFEDIKGAIKWIDGQITKLSKSSTSKTEEYLHEHTKMQKMLEGTLLLWTHTDMGLLDAYEKLGMKFFAYIYHDYPELISNWFSLKIKASLREIDNYLEYQKVPIAFIGEDIAYNNTLLFSPDFLRKEFFPGLKLLIESFHRKGIKVIFHSDGNIMPILDDLVDTGIDGLNPIEPQAGMDLSEVKEIIGDKVVLIGNIDCSHLLPFGSKDEVRNKVRETINTMSDKNGFVLASSSELHNEIPLENIIAMIEAGRRYGLQI